MSCYAQGWGTTTPSPMSDPLTYCAVSQLDSSFNHPSTGRLNGPYSGNCQAFMAQRCAGGWDSVCEYKSQDTNRHYPNMVSECNSPLSGGCIGPGWGSGMTSGDNLVAGTATEKYMVAMSDHCVRKYEPFDPTVQASPLISKWVPSGDSCANGECGSHGGTCVAIFDVDPATIDNDPVMNKVLAKPWIWLTGLLSIYNNRMRKGNIHELKNTRLYKHVFSQKWFHQVNAKQGVARF